MRLMLAIATKSRLADALEDLSHAAAEVRAHAADADASAGLVTSALRAADDLTAAAAAMVGALASRGGIERASGLPDEMALRLVSRRMAWDAREILNVADTLRQMPRTAAALADGSLSWSQTRAIVRAIGCLDRAGRGAVDELVGRRAPGLAQAEPEALQYLVDDLVSRLRDDLALRREDRAIEASFLALQARLDGGGSLYGEADPESFATIAEALHAAADTPVGGEDAAGSRARQRMDALVAICESHLAGDADVGRTRPRPRLIAAVDLNALIEMGVSEGARVLAAVAGRPCRLTPLSTEVLACDAEIVTVLFDGMHPVAIGDATQAIPAKVRAALIARDGGCRFPGCGAPASWADAHHVVPRSRGGASDITNLILLCRRCHRRVHRRGWRIDFGLDGALDFRHRGQRFVSVPRMRSPARE